MLAANFRD